MKLAALPMELRRRNVLRAGVLHAGAVWALAQGIAQLGPSVGAPDWATRWFLIAAIIGFPFWLAFAWFFEFTRSGLKRESEVDPADSVVRFTGRKLDFWIIGLLAVVVVLLLTNQFVVRHDATHEAGAQAAETVAATLAKVPDKSIAVLPLINESGDPKQQYFSDGLSEELISDLARINALKVIGKYSSFKFRDSKDSPAQIDTMLGVTHLLSGSVCQQGQRARIQVDLIKAVAGSSVWSQTYDRDLKDVFAIQSEIGQAVAGALKIQLLGQSLIVDDKPPSGDIEAYQPMLRGRAVARRASASAYRQAIPVLLQVLSLQTCSPIRSSCATRTTRASPPSAARSDCRHRASCCQIRRSPHRRARITHPERDFLADLMPRHAGTLMPRYEVPALIIASRLQPYRGRPS
jgi:TolB-like protein